MIKKFYKYIKKKLWPLYSKISTWYFKDKIDVYVVSFPKSGRTWIRVFLAKYNASVFNRKIKLSFRPWILKKGEQRIYFCHTGFQENDKELIRKEVKKLAKKRVVFLARHPCDIVVSYYYHMQNRVSVQSEYFSKEVVNMKLSEFIRDPHFGIVQIVKFVNNYIDQNDIYEDFIILKYEDLKKDSNEFLKLLYFVGHSTISEKYFNEAIEYSSFENMVEMEKKNALNDSRLQAVDITNRNSYKVRKGKVGGYKDEFSADDIKYAKKVLKSLNPMLNYTV